MLLKVGCFFFLLKSLYYQRLFRIFAAREPAKPLNDAQMRGAFFFYNSSMSKYMALVGLLSSFLSESKRSIFILKVHYMLGSTFY